MYFRMLQKRDKRGTVVYGMGGPVKGLLILGGSAPHRVLLTECRRGADIVVAADSGLEHALALGIEPDLVVGDMDSLADLGLLSRFPPERIMRFAKDKDETDAEIGLRILQEKGCVKVVLAGGGGGRLDHLLALAMMFERDAPPNRWITDKEDVLLVDGDAELELPLGSIVSFFPVGPYAADMFSRGLRWRLDGLTFRRGYGGISNVVTENPVRVGVGRGRLLMIRSLSEGRA
jgi:thiamine pyrophosphokinase